MNWYVKLKYHRTMEEFWFRMKLLAFKLPVSLYKRPYYFAHDKYEYHAEKTLKLYKSKRP